MKRPAHRRSLRRAATTALAASMVALLAPALPTGAEPYSAADPGPDSHSQPLTDGCQRSDAMSLTLTTPEWVYVNRAEVAAARLSGDQTAGRQTVEGTVDDIHPAGDDLFVNHDYNDIDLAVKPDNQKDMALVASGNGGDLGTEWEGTLIPTWAWPQVGDHVRESGSWIWDCGHWGNGPADDTGLSQFLPYDPEETLRDLASPGTISGEQTELHPLYEVATWRKDAAGVLRGVSGGRDLQRLDVWINGDGGPALSEEECALLGIPNGSASSTPACSRYRDVGGTYTYTMNVGPSAGQLVVNPVEVHAETDKKLRSVPVQVTKNPAAGTVTVKFTLPHEPVPQRFGITVEAGWSDAPLAVHHVVTLDSLRVNATLDGPTEPNINPLTSQFPDQVRNGPVREQTPDPGEWVLYAQVNGNWWQIDPSKLRQVKAKTTYRLHHVWSIWLPAGVAPTLYVSGRECDIPLIDCTQERYGAPPRDNMHPFLELGFNDKPGRIEFGNTGLPLTPGDHTYAPLVNPVPTNSSEDYSDATCGGPCYSVRVTAS